MKKTIGIIIFLMIIIISNNIKATNIVAIGDSITYGYAVEENQKYVNIIAEKLSESNETNCINLAINGLTTEGLIEELQKDGIEKQISKADYILMSIGGNDFLNIISNNNLMILSKNISLSETTNKMSENLNKICGILTTKSHAEILVVPLYNPYYEMIKSNENLINEYQEAKDIFCATLEKYDKVHVMNITNDLEKAENLTEEFYDPHPNANGQKIIADSELKTIGELNIQKETQNEQAVITNSNKWSIGIKIAVIMVSIIIVLLIIIYIERKK